MRRPSFLRSFINGVISIGEGMASIGGFGFYPPHSRSYEELFGTDAERLASDWKNVGDDLRRAMQQEGDFRRRQ